MDYKLHIASSVDMDQLIYYSGVKKKIRHKDRGETKHETKHAIDLRHCSRSR